MTDMDLVHQKLQRMQEVLDEIEKREQRKKMRAWADGVSASLVGDAPLHSRDDWQYRWYVESFLSRPAITSGVL